MTTRATVEEGVAHVFVKVDHCTHECVGIHAAKSGKRFEALEPIRDMVRYHYELHSHAYIYFPLMLYAVNEEVGFLPYESQNLRLKETSVTDNHWSVREEAKVE